MTVYAGLDVNPYGAHSKSSTFSVTIIRGDETQRSFQSVRSNSLSSLIKQNHVDVLAFDNLAELAPVLSRLTFELSKLERTVEFVEVAHDEPLEVKCQRLGLFGGGKLPPQLASEMVAKLARMGHGKKLDLFSPKTVIRVVRRRVPGSGGSSTLRFKRNVEAQIKFLKGRIEAKLKAAKLDYDVYVRESTGGYSSATFIVYSDSGSLRGVVYPFVGRDYAVKVEKIQARFRYKEPSRSSRPLIVGYDPGITTGIALVDLSGSLLSAMSARNFDRTDAVSFCTKYGSPVIVATDVSAPPDAVKRLGAAFGAKLFVPSEDLSVEEKRELVRRLNVQVKTTHERDAAAAAIKAYGFYSKLLNALKQRAASEGLSPHILELVRSVLNGKNIETAISELRSKYELNEAPQPKHPQPVAEDQAMYSKHLETELSLLRARLLDAESRAIKAEERSLELENKVKSLLSEREAALRRDREIVNLEFRLTELTKILEEARVSQRALEAVVASLIEALRKLSTGRVIAVRAVDDLSRSTIEKLFSEQNSRAEVLFVRNPNNWDAEGLAQLRGYGVQGIIVHGEAPVVPPAFEDHEIAVIGGGGVGVQEIPTADTVLVNTDALRLIREKVRDLQQRNKEKKIAALRRLLEDAGDAFAY
jgi:predicted RNase H-like nuclease (RuvC/YqgF family)